MLRITQFRIYNIIYYVYDLIQWVAMFIVHDNEVTGFNKRPNHHRSGYRSNGLTPQ